MKKLLFVIVTTLIATSALAQSKLAFDGPYVGISLGYNQTSVGEGVASAYYPPTNPSAAIPGTYFMSNGSNSNSSGMTEGLNFGYDHRIGDFVIGGEIGASLLQGTANGYAGSGGYGEGYTFPNAPVASTTQLKSLYVAKPKVGYAFNFLEKQTMVYAMGGLALGVVTRTLTDKSATTNTAPEWYTTNPSSTTQNSYGYTAGAGFEMMLVENLSIKFEFNYVNLGNINFTYNNGSYLGVSANTTQSVKITNTATTLGLSYKF